MSKTPYKTSLLLFIALCFSVPAFSKEAPSADKLAKIPQKTEFSFIENKGQWDNQIKYKAEVPEGVMFLTDKGFVFNYVKAKDFDNVHELMDSGGDFGNAIIHQYAYKVNFLNANANPKYETNEKRKNYNNYFIGNDPSKWKSNVGLFGKIKQKDIYNGIDLAVYSKGLVLKYDFIVAPNAATSQIEMSYEGVTPIITSTGNLKIKTSINEIMEQAPYSYQMIEGKEVEVKSNFTLRNGVVGFEFPNGYNKNYELVIDPVLVFATYSGAVGNGSGFYSFSTTYDTLGNMYAGAQAYEAGWPTTVGAIQSIFAGGQDVAVNKYNALGSALIYSTYYGGSGVDLPHAMKVNAQDELYVTGSTTSFNLPTTTGAYDNSLGGSTDIFVAHFNNTATVLLGSTYIGGNSNEPVTFSLNGTSSLAPQNTTSPLELDFDYNNNVWIVSSTQSTDFPIVLPAAFNTYTENAKVCPGGTYIFGTQNLTTAGTYVDTFTTTGCDSIVTLILSVTPIVDTISASICAGTSYTLGTQTLIAAGTYTEIFPTGTCDSTVTLHLSLKPLKTDSVSATVCPGISYSFGTNNLTSSGVYVDTFSTTGCDSIVVLNLLVKPVVVDTAHETMCSGGTYYFGDSIITSAGTYIDTFSRNCYNDSIVTLILTADTANTYTIHQFMCLGNTYVFGTQNLTTSGTYTQIFTGTSTCDSIVKLNLTVGYSTRDTTDYFCPGSSYIFGSTTLTSPGNYTDTVLDGTCNVILTLHLKAKQTYSDTVSTFVCAGTSSYNFGSQVLTTNGTYTEVFTSSIGCDSTVTLNIAFGTYTTDTVREMKCPNSNYYFGSNVLTSSGIYVDTFNSGTCNDSIVVLILNTTLSSTSKGGVDGVLFQLDPTCSNLMFSGYMGGTSNDGIVGIQINSDSNLVICGPTQSSNFPTTPFSMHPTALGGTFDGFVSIIRPETGAILHSTFLGTSSIDQAVNLQIDDSDNVFVLGRTLGNYPISPNTFNVANGDLFIDKLSPDLSASLLSTRLGAAQTSTHFFPAAFLLDICGNVYVTGLSATSGMPLSPDAIQTATNPFWFGVLTTNFASLFYGSYFGASGDHTHVGVSRMDPEGIVYHSICNNTPTYPLATSASNPNPYRLNKTTGSGQDIVSFKFNFEATGVRSHFVLDSLLSPKDTGCVPFTVHFDNTSTTALTYLWDFGDGTNSTQTNETHTYLTPGVYEVKLKAFNPNTCITEDSSTINIVVLETNLPNISTNDTIVCRTLTSLDLKVNIANPSPNNLFEWGPATGILSGANQATVTVNPALNNVYYVIVKDTIPGICGFSASDTVRIDYAPRSLTILNNDTTVCAGTIIQIDALGTDGYNYSWSPAIGVSDSTILNPSITLNQSDVYALTATHGGCPDTTTSIEFTVQPNPNLVISNDTSVCPGSQVALESDVTPFRNDYIYQWSPSTGLGFPNNPNVKLIADTTITYQLHIQTPIGCSDSAQVVVTVFPKLNGEVIKDTGYCPPGAVDLWAKGGLTYHWSPSYGLSNSDISNPVANPFTTTYYTVEITDQNGCMDSQNVTVQVYPLAVLEMPDSVDIYSGESYHLQSQSNALYFQWFPPSGINDPKISDPTFNPEVRTRYFVTATTENGCILKDSIDILVKDNLIEMPNAFTPGNGINNEFKAINRGIYKINNFSIFNRWGNMVFSTSDINIGWDGTYKGKPQPMGVYVYIIDAQADNGKRFQQKGDVTLIR